MTPQHIDVPAHERAIHAPVHGRRNYDRQPCANRCCREDRDECIRDGVCDLPDGACSARRNQQQISSAATAVAAAINTTATTVLHPRDPAGPLRDRAPPCCAFDRVRVNDPLRRFGHHRLHHSAAADQFMCQFNRPHSRDAACDAEHNRPACKRFR